MLAAAACREEPARMGPAGTRHFRTSGSETTRSPGQQVLARASNSTPAFRFAWGHIMWCCVVLIRTREKCGKGWTPSRASLREQLEGRHMVRPYDAEVPSIQRGDLADLQAFGCRDDGGVHRAERKVTVARGQFGDAQPVTGEDRLRGQRAGSEITQEPDLWYDAEARRDEVGDLAHDEDRDE